MFRKVDLEPFHSLPRHNTSTQSPSPSPATVGPAPKRAVVFGKHFQLPTLRVSSKRSNSAPNLGLKWSGRESTERNIFVPDSYVCACFVCVLSYLASRLGSYHLDCPEPYRVSQRFHLNRDQSGFSNVQTPDSTA